MAKHKGFVVLYLKRPLEAVAFRALALLFGALPVDWASGFGGWFARSLGPHLPVTQRAVANLKLALPGISEAEIRRIVTGMWENFGRTYCEFPHLSRIVHDPERLEVVDERDEVARTADGQAAVYVAGHLANWELLAAALSRHLQRDVTLVVREPSNPLVRGLVERGRAAAAGRRVAKGASGSKEIVATLRRGGALLMLCDQKLNKGLAMPFFGVEARTPTAPARLALRFDCPIEPFRMERLGGARFRMTLGPALAKPDAADNGAAVAQLTGRINNVLEDWIRARPAQWFWLHRRWPPGATRGD